MGNTVPTDSDYSLADEKRLFAAIVPIFNDTKTIFNMLGEDLRESFVLYLLEQDTVDKETIAVALNRITDDDILSSFGVFISCLFHDDPEISKMLKGIPYNDLDRSIIESVLARDVEGIVRMCHAERDTPVDLILCSLLVRCRQTFDTVLSQLVHSTSFQELFNLISLDEGEYYTKYYLELERHIIKAYNWDLYDNTRGFSTRSTKRLRFLLMRDDV